MATDPPDGRHVALVFKLDDADPPRRCHVLWHHKLGGEVSSGRHPWVQSPLGKSRKRLIANICDSIVRRIEANNPKVNFGFSFDLKCFDSSGRFQSAVAGQGFTCATFVLEVFRRGGVRLLQSWQYRDGDKAWQGKVIAELEGQKADPNHVEALKKLTSENEVFRIRPEEACAAAAYAPPPLNFDDGQRLGQEFLRILERYRASGSLQAIS